MLSPEVLMGESVFVLLLVAWPVGTIWGYRRAVHAGDSEGMAGLGALLRGPLAPLLAFVKPARPLPPPK